MGRGDQFRRTRCRPGARVLHRQCRLLDRRISSRRAATGRDAADLRRLRGHMLAAIVRRVRERGERPERPSSSARTSRRTPGSCAPLRARRLWARRAMERRFPSQRDRRADRTAARPITPITAARRRNSSPPPSTAFFIRGSVTRGSRKRAARRRSTCRRNASSSFSRTTTRSPIRGTGQRCHALTSPGRLRAMTACLLLMPGMPMLFQGQEFAASTPFLYFADHESELADAVARGRAAVPRAIPQPRDERDAGRARRSRRYRHLPPMRCSISANGERHAPHYALHRDLLALRRDDPVLRPAARRGSTARCSASEAWLLRFFSQSGDDRLLLVNLGRDCCWRRRRSRCWRRSRARLGRSYGRAKRRVMAAAGRRRWTPTAICIIPGQSAAVLIPGPSAAVPRRRRSAIRGANG